ncbi:hypothetical protein [Bacillus sp. FJAT-42315]|uniref:hypothetical protein n=1 Tax=Bacillus sp. FJAT-42315 TaxID=2014077 RepID=UPI000C235DB1|nr:hypothetical protein [Bacillus sp. FJAT-42315]
MDIYNMVIIPLILGVVELFKKIGLPTKYSPIVAVFFGMLFGVFYLDQGVKQGILVGLILGLSASGLYSGSKNMLEKRKEK